MWGRDAIALVEFTTVVNTIPKVGSQGLHVYLGSVVLNCFFLNIMNRQRWELGAVFLPDSIGYLVAASCLATPAYTFGRQKAAAAACLLLAASLAMVKNIYGTHWN